MPHIVDVSNVLKRDGKIMPGIINIEAMTTLTGEQKQMLDGIVVETRPSHRVNAPGLPAGGSDAVPVVKVKKSATNSAMGMQKIRGTKY
jgi:hypothetical protein